MNKLFSVFAVLFLLVALTAGQSPTQNNFVSKDGSDSSALAKKSSCKNGHSAEQWDFFVGKNSPWDSVSADLDDDEGVGILPPVSILSIVSIEGKDQINWYHTGKNVTHPGWLNIEKGYSQIHTKLDEKNHSGCYSIFYCKTHLVVLVLDLAPKEQCKKPTDR